MTNKIILFKFMDIYGKCYLVAPSVSGKNLGKYKTKKEAEKRLKQVEYFKHKDKK